MNLFIELYYFSLFVEFIPLAVIAIFKLFKSKDLRYFIIYLSFNFAINCLTNLPVKTLWGFEDNMFFYIFQSAVNILLISSIYSSQSFLYRKLRFVLFAFQIIALVLIGYSYTTYIIIACLESAYTIALAFLYIVALHKTYRGNSLRTEPILWFSSGFILFHTFRFIFFSISNDLLQYSLDLFRLLGNLLLPVTDIIALIQFIIGLYFFIKKSKL